MFPSAYGSSRPGPARMVPRRRESAHGAPPKLPTAPANGTRVALEPCGISSKTVWIYDGPLSSLTNSTAAEPLISGATDNSFFDPYVITALSPGLPLSTSMLRISGAALAPYQVRGAKFGQL